MTQFDTLYQLDTGLGNYYDSAWSSCLRLNENFDILACTNAIAHLAKAEERCIFIEDYALRRAIKRELVNLRFSIVNEMTLEFINA